jgi:hypothetical protein
MPNNLLVRALIFLFFSHAVILFSIYAFPDYVSPIEAILPINTTALSAAMTAAVGARPALLTRSLLLSNPQQCMFAGFSWRYTCLQNRSIAKHKTKSRSNADRNEINAFFGEAFGCCHN